MSGRWLSVLLLAVAELAGAQDFLKDAPDVSAVTTNGVVIGSRLSDVPAFRAFLTLRALARRGDVVVITLQYRLGVFGFLELADLGGAEYADSGNVGILDQIAALEWVRQDAEHFGGDPGNVTLFGESAGGASVRGLMAVPRAKNLFHKVIIESADPGQFVSLDVAENVAREFGGSPERPASRNSTN